MRAKSKDQQEDERSDTDVNVIFGCQRSPSNLGHEHKQAHHKVIKVERQSNEEAI
jgi:hypothetical protein